MPRDALAASRRGLQPHPVSPPRWQEPKGLREQHQTANFEYIRWPKWQGQFRESGRSRSIARLVGRTGFSPCPYWPADGASCNGYHEVHQHEELRMKRNPFQIAIGGEQRLRKAVEAQVRREHQDQLAAATDASQKSAIEQKIQRAIKQMKRVASPCSLWSSKRL